LTALTERIIGAAIEVHRQLGPGLLESVYETCLAFELEKLGLIVERQKPFSETFSNPLILLLQSPRLTSAVSAFPFFSVR
jgi:GxxExxY protein